MKLLALFILLTSSAFAHFKIGTYKGHYKNGNECQIEFKEKLFTNGIKNPLNEIVKVKVDKVMSFDLTHPITLSEDSLEIRFVEKLISYKGTKSGAQAFVVHMDDKGPSSFHFINDNWRQNSSKSKDCLGLRFQE